MRLNKAFTRKQVIGLGFFILLFLAGFYVSGYYLQASSAINNTASIPLTLYHQRVFKQACSIGCTNCEPDVPMCTEVDNDRRAGLIKEQKIEVPVPDGGGYLALYFNDLEDHQSYYGEQMRGGFTFSDVYFKPTGSDTHYSLNNGLRVWEAGTVFFAFDQPYMSGRRLKMNYQFILHYLPHNSVEKRFYLDLSSKGAEQVKAYKDDNRYGIGTLCTAIRDSNYIPAGCPGGKTGDAKVVKLSPSQIRQAQGEGAIRPTLFTLPDTDLFVFKDQPVEIRLQEAYDPDGLCADFGFEWEHRTPTQRVAEWESNDDDWSLFFIPRSVGDYFVRVRSVEFCEDLGSLTSDWQTFRVHSANRSVDFSDVNDAPGYQGYILELYNRGVMTGYPDKTMRPLNPVNRAEFLKMLFETLQYEIPRTSYSSEFGDLRGNEWFAEYVFEGARLGIVQGYPDGYFRPQSSVNRVEALKMALNMVDLEVKDTLLIQFGDVSPLDWFSRYVQTAYREGIVEGVVQGENFFPGEFITRAEAAKIIVRTFIEPVNRINQVQLNKVK